MKKLWILISVVGVFVVGLVGGIGSVSAQEATETPTPTITNTPVFTPTVTQASQGFISTQHAYETAVVDNYDCPDALPTFWLTKTPSARWWNECSNCWIPTMPSLPTVTGTITPTWDPALPTYTPTVTPIGAIPTQEDGLFTIKQNGVSIIEGQVVSNITTGQEYDNGLAFEIFDHASKTVTVGYVYEISGQIRNSSYAVERVGIKVVNQSANYALTVNIKEVNGSAVNETRVVDAGGYLWYPTWIWEGSSSPNPLTFPTQTIKFDVISVNDPNKTSEYYVGMRADFYSSDSNNKTTVKYWVNGSVDTLNQPAPTITPTPINSYCSVVESNQIEADFFGFSGLIFSESNCMDVGGIYIDVLGIKIDIPVVAHLCFQGVDFGTLNIFGLAISIQTIMLLVAGVWGVSFLLHA